jgi:hypothetical protein
VEREDANVLAYNSPVTARLLLGGHVDPPSWATPLVKTLEVCTGLPGNRQWINDQRNRNPGGSYMFGGLASPGSGSSPSFFRKKKKENPNFPPATWGVESNSGSYFTDAAPLSHSRNMTWSGTNRSDLEGTAPSGSFSSSQSLQLNSQPDTTNPFNTLRTSNLTLPPHRRNLSLNLPNTNHDPFDNDTDDIYAPTTIKTSNLTVQPTINPREELATQLLPHEGAARAIALFNFDAVEDGDLSFKKGDIIVITKKSDSTDDWHVSWLLMVSSN